MKLYRFALLFFDGTVITGTFCLNSDNSIVKTIANSAKCSSVSNFGDNYRYLSYKYKIGNHVWNSPLCKLLKCFDSYM